MTAIELLVLLLLLVMAVPDVCVWLKRPALVYPAFVCFGILVGPLIHAGVGAMVREAGEVGFVLLLFEVGQEIDLPVWRQLQEPAKFVLRWVLPQYPLILALAHYAGLPWLESFVATAALSACSVGMAHVAWKQYPGLEGASRVLVLQVMVLLEVIAVVLLAAETAVLGDSSAWEIGLKFLGMAIVIYTCSRVSSHVTAGLQRILQRTTRWRLHFVTLLILAICAVGERLGLAAAKTAFFLGLFSSRVRHEGRSLDDYMAPISRRFLIPLFFTALGTQLALADLFSRSALLALVSAGLILAFRHVLHARFAKTGGDANAYLLLCPNFSLVALAANSLLVRSGGAEMGAWLLMVGLLVTIVAIVALPAAVATDEVSDGNTRPLFPVRGKDPA